MSLEKKLEALREQFRRDYHAELKNLVTLWQSAREQKGKEALKQFHFSVHSLKGSSGALNLMQLSHLLRDIEAIVRPLMESDALDYEKVAQVDGHMNKLIATSKNAHNSFLEQADKDHNKHNTTPLSSE